MRTVFRRNLGMRGRLMAAAALSTLMLAAPMSANAQTGNVVVEGNQRIEAATILSYLNLGDSGAVSAESVNAASKRLFETGLFSDVQIMQRGGQVVVVVQENPVVNQVAFEGNNRIKDEQLAGIVQSAERRVFTRARAEQDAEAILEAYRRSGRYAAAVTPKIIELDQNRVDLVFEVDEGPQTDVSSIRFVGNTAFSDSRLRSAIATSESGWWKIFSTTDSYDPDRLEYDKELLARYYRARGYADVQVRSAVAELSPDRSGFYLTFTVDEGPYYTFGDIDVASSAPGVDPEALRSAIVTESGAMYDIEAVEKSISEMTYLLGERGYAFTSIEPMATKNADTNTIDIVYEVKEGAKVYVERIDIEGNTRTLDKVIRREFELVEGDAFNAVQLQRSRANVRGLGFFKSVDVKTEPGSADDRVVIKTDVQEQSTGQLSFGLGFSSGDGVAGEVSITERNLLGRGQYLRLSGQLSATSRIYDIRFTEPYFLDRNLAAGFDLFRLEYDRTSTSGYQTRTTGFRPRLSFPLGQYARLSTRYEISQDEILKVPTTASPLIQAEIGSELTSSVGYTLTYDRRNDPLEPTRGYLLTLDQDVAGLGGDARYVRTEASGKVFRSLFRDDVIGSVEVAGGGIIGFGGYKPRANDRFSLGGDSFRGFRSSGLGPRDGSDFLGGKYYGMVRTEVSFPIGLPDEYGVYGGVFADAGTLFSLDNVNGTTTVDDGLKMRASLGASLFWTSPFGPIRLNFATPVVKQDGDEAEYFRFTIGGRF